MRKSPSHNATTTHTRHRSHTLLYVYLYINNLLYFVVCSTSSRVRYDFVFFTLLSIRYSR
ncbi:unnamed protein product [Aphis gossypii]|uniref:Longin domain-containing protein n=1 Tax=Aphis gossypii TaxID=80765 RepID=A0A9P0NLD1_APHGO|nr:unnamed protein product [Aphis gossypii]